MSVLEFIRQHPAQAVDVISSKDYDRLMPMRAMALARDRPEDMEILDWTVCHSSFPGGDAGVKGEAALAGLLQAGSVRLADLGNRGDLIGLGSQLGGEGDPVPGVQGPGRRPDRRGGGRGRNGGTRLVPHLCGRTAGADDGLQHRREHGRAELPIDDRLMNATQDVSTQCFSGSSIWRNASRTCRKSEPGVFRPVSGSRPLERLPGTFSQTANRGRTWTPVHP